MKDPECVKFVLQELVPKCDIFLESFRPGVLEKMGLGPSELHNIKPDIIVARLSGWGPYESEYKKLAGHDMNYLAVSGILDKFKRTRDGNPVSPGNILADFSAGSLGLLT
jgi:alpha-methylacyl-CoA racemase